MKRLKKHNRRKQAFSLVEILLAIALIGVIGISLLSTLSVGVDSSSKTEQQNKATFLANEGLEAVRNIRDAAFTNLVDGTYGLTTTGNQWNLSGSSDTTGIYTRQVTISTVDTYTKRAIATVTWDGGKQVSYTQDFTNWTRSVGGFTPYTGGMLVYVNGNGTNDSVYYRVLDGTTDTWSAPAAVPDPDTTTINKAARTLRLYTSSTRSEKILLVKYYNGTQQTIFAHVWNGLRWSVSQQLAQFNSSTNPEDRNFDGGYLSNGNFMAVYSVNSNTPAYRVWNGTSWAAQANTANMQAAPLFLTIKVRPGTNTLMMITEDASKRTAGSYYDGSTWSARNTMGSNSTYTGREMIDFVWSGTNSPTSGYVYYARNNTDLGYYVMSYNVGIGWSVTGFSTPAIPGTPSTVAAVNKPNNNQYYYSCGSDSTSTISCFQNNFGTQTAPTPSAVITSTTDSGGQRPFDLEMEQSSAIHALVVYSDSTAQAKYRIYDTSVNSIGTQQNFGSALGANLKTVRMTAIPGTDDIMVMMADANKDLYTTMWNGSGNAIYSTGARAFTAQGTQGSNTLDYWYDYQPDLYSPNPTPPAITLAQSNISVGTGTSTTQIVTMPNSVAVGNVMVVAISDWNLAGATGCNLQSLTDNKGNSYTLVATTTATAQSCSMIYYAPITTGGSGFNVIATVPTGRTYKVTVGAHEYSGIRTSGTVDQSRSLTNAGAVNYASTGNMTATTYANDLIFATFYHQSGGVIDAIPGSNFTPLLYYNDGNNEPMFTEARLVTATGAYNADVSYLTSIGFLAVVVAFKGP